MTPAFVDVWSDEAIAARWLCVFPVSSDGPSSVALCYGQILRVMRYVSA
jgi:hypothetical protein